MVARKTPHRFPAKTPESASPLGEGKSGGSLTNLTPNVVALPRRRGKKRRKARGRRLPLPWWVAGGESHPHPDPLPQGRGRKRGLLLREVVARKTGGSETPPLRQETEKTAGWGWVLHPGGGSTRGAGYGPPAHHERLWRTETGYPQGVPLQAKTNRHPDLGG